MRTLAGSRRARAEIREAKARADAWRVRAAHERALRLGLTIERNYWIVEPDGARVAPMAWLSDTALLYPAAEYVRP